MKAGKSGEKQQSSGILIENLPAGAITNAGKYIPPHLRGNNIIGITLNLWRPNRKQSLGLTASNAKNSPKNGPAKDKSPEEERIKKIKNVQKKLDDIKKLKERVSASGVVLEKNQQMKIQNEPKLLEELENLTLGIVTDWSKAHKISRCLGYFRDFF